MNIQLCNVTKKFRDKTILNNLNITFPSGHSSGLIEPNGVGKTTLLRMLFYLDTDYQGDISFNNIKIMTHVFFRKRPLCKIIKCSI